MSMIPFAEILTAAVQAPSGDNSQPWKFIVSGETISIVNLPERDNPIFNFRQRGSYVAHGALLENISIAASHFGYGSRIDLFPDSGILDLVATVKLEKTSVKEDPLYELIFRRSTNRKYYQNVPLQTQQLRYLEDSQIEVGFGKSVFVSDINNRKIIANAVSLAERIMLENRGLHDYFFEHVRWTATDESKYRSGLFVKTLELASPQLLIFRLLKNWSIARVFRYLNIPKLIARENAKIYASGSLIGIITIGEETDKNFIQVGRLLQRIWLKTTQMNMSLQPLAGTIYLAQRVAGDKAGDKAEVLSEKHKNLVRSALEEIRSASGITHETIAMIFRIGNGGTPSANSSRLPPDITSS